MKFLVRATVGAFLLGCLASLPASAAGPVDGEFQAVWWASDFHTTGGAANLTTDAGAPSYRGELWLFNRYGFRAGRYSTDLEEVGLTTSHHTSLDFLWKALAPTENNFLATGFGWQEMDIPVIGLDGTTSGARLSLEARFGIATMVYVFAEGSYYPSLDDGVAVNPADGRFEDLSGREYEFGISWKMAPFLRLRGGYRKSSVDFTRTLAAGEGRAEWSGYFYGLGLQF